jgi:hypothetical protein
MLFKPFDLLETCRLLFQVGRLVLKVLWVLLKLGR